MVSLGQLCRRLFRKPSLPRLPSTAKFQVINNKQDLEEERFSWYSPTRFYQVHIGDLFKSRYQVVGKLGYGTASTVWLCRDLKVHAYVTLKICEHDSIQAKREIKANEHLNAMITRHSGSLFVRTALDVFEIKGQESIHQCLVYKPLGMSLSRLRSHCPSRKFPEQLLKPALIHLLFALDFLHTEAKMVHTDLQQNNILLGVEDDYILSDFEEAERAEPSPRKIDGQNTIYMSRELPIPKKHGRPVLSDFGEARFGQEDYSGDIQPFIYRAPEVALRMRWDSKVDIWSAGMLAWDLFENKHLFNAEDGDGKDSTEHHLAEMIALMGLPPKSFLEGSDAASRYFNEHGEWKGTAEIPAISLESAEENLQGRDKVLFLDFMRKMLQWAPDERKSAKELLKDPWLRGPSSP